MDTQWFEPVAQSTAMGAAALDFAWETTALGPISTWDASLRQAVQTCFSTRFPVLVAWGPDLTMIYNDGYRDMLGSEKRLTALGAPLAQVWAEIWDDLAPLLDDVMTSRTPTWSVDTELVMNRSGFDEQTFFTFSYSALVDDHGQVAGIMDIATESTRQVLATRRLTLVDSLHAELQEVDGPAHDLAVAAVAVLSTSRDLARCAVLTRTHAGQDLDQAGDAGLVEVVPADLVQQVMSTRKTSTSGSTLVVPVAGTKHGEADGVLLAEVAPTLVLDADLRAFVGLAGSAIAGALRSATAQSVQVALGDASTRLSELEVARSREVSLTLQHSLLTSPPQPDHLHIVVRYHPTSDDLAVGGDWYDAFLNQDGATVVVVGDVVGHDHHAAAAMGQLRGLVRAIAYDTGVSPAKVLERTDHAIHGLGLGPGATATGVVAQIEQTAGHPAGTRTVRWANAGHPHPVILRADGTTEVLARTNDLLLGIVPDRVRTDHTVDLLDRDTLLIFTDGLVERRGEPMQQSLQKLLGVLEGGQDKTLDELADHLLGVLNPGDVRDDIALILVRPFPQDQPRPAEAGPVKDIPTPVP